MVKSFKSIQQNTIQKLNNNVTIEKIFEKIGEVMFFGKYTYKYQIEFTVRRNGNFYGNFKTQNAANNKAYNLGGL